MNSHQRRIHRRAQLREDIAMIALLSRPGTFTPKDEVEQFIEKNRWQTVKMEGILGLRGMFGESR